ncbi:hypothetical protein POM88_054446 [Heracleum sosnowskyi]|uniref:Uncharacterized protein n=1 Tax=Heracleum sosnowskyi TaxID=360622 RepID=A0AAD8LUU4_9APIA|nr:hypothetical protein POM88_054446 [Heracleum sosnowskyi]
MDSEIHSSEDESSRSENFIAPNMNVIFEGEQNKQEDQSTSQEQINHSESTQSETNSSGSDRNPSGVDEENSSTSSKKEAKKEFKARVQGGKINDFKLTSKGFSEGSSF